MNEFDKKARKIAKWTIFIMIAIWIVLSIFSFMKSEERGRPDTQQVYFEGQSALKGKQVFQSFNCMDCHTIVGNGAYFAPDLTKIYEETGPAWLKAYLGSPASYPPKAVVNLQLLDLLGSGETEIGDIDTYLEKYPGAKKRVENRGGVAALMPNLRFTSEEISALIAFLKYTSKIKTGGWPPKVIANENIVENMKRKLETESGLHLVGSVSGAVGSTEGAGGSSGTASPAALGEELATNLGCMACHSTDGSVKIGPSFKGIYGSSVKLTTGETVEIDSSYLRRSILSPSDEVVEGFPEGVMPAYEGIVSEEELSNIIEFIKSQK